MIAAAIQSISRSRACRLRERGSGTISSPTGPAASYWASRSFVGGMARSFASQRLQHRHGRCDLHSQVLVEKPRGGVRDGQLVERLGERQMHQRLG
jgi:hypothetical protein